MSTATADDDRDQQTGAALQRWPETGQSPW